MICALFKQVVNPVVLSMSLASAMFGRRRTVAKSRFKENTRAHILLATIRCAIRANSEG